MQTDGTRGGFTLLRLLTAMLVTGLALAGSVSGFRSMAIGAQLTGAARTVRAHFGYARAVAIARRTTVALTLGPAGELLLLDPGDSVIRRAPLLGTAGYRLDSVRIRPTVIRFNPRGQAAAGSIYLYKGQRGARLVVNFVGRVREERLP